MQRTLHLFVTWAESIKLIKTLLQTKTYKNPTILKKIKILLDVIKDLVHEEAFLKQASDFTWRPSKQGHLNLTKEILHP